MTTEQPIEFRFPAVRSKLQNLFPFDPKYDIEIVFRNNKYELQTAYLRLESGFFKNFNPNVSKVIKIQEEFDEVYFEETMKCFYGGVFNCPRSSIFEAWKIFDYLRIESFKKQAIKDMKQNFEKYNFFELMAFGFQNNVEQLFSNCLNILDNNNFIQFKKNKEQVLFCPLELFKFLVNTHNRRPKNKRALNFIEVNALLAEYSQKNEYSEQFYKELKFQLIQKTQLTAEEYRLIFIEGVRSQSTRQIPDINFSKKSLKVPEIVLAESAQILTSKPIANDQKQHWLQKLQNLKTFFEKRQNDSRSLQCSVDILSKSIKRKAQESRIKERTLAKMQNSVRQIQKEINEKRQNLKKITERIQKLQNSSGKGKGKNSKEAEPQQEEKDVFVESHIIPSYFLGDVIGEAQNTKKQSGLKITASSNQEPNPSTANFAKNKKSLCESTLQRQNSQEYMYKNCLMFDKEPISVPRKYLDNLAKIMDTDEFVKKRQLSLLFRRSRTDRNNIGDPSAIKNRPGLLVLFETSYKKYAGGYLSVEIPTFTKADSLCDYQAFIFSLTHNVKMPMMKGEQKSAISLSKHYLLSFANDLMISNDCLNEVSYCEWPGIYEVPKNSKCTSAKDLIGASGQFKIEQIDIYEVKNQQIEMIL